MFHMSRVRCNMSAVSCPLYIKTVTAPALNIEQWWYLSPKSQLISNVHEFCYVYEISLVIWTDINDDSYNLKCHKLNQIDTFSHMDNIIQYEIRFCSSDWKINTGKRSVASADTSGASWSFLQISPFQEILYDCSMFAL